MSDCRYDVSPVNYPDPDPDVLALRNLTSPKPTEIAEYFPANYARKGCYISSALYMLYVMLLFLGNATDG